MTRVIMTSNIVSFVLYAMCFASSTNGLATCKRRVIENILRCNNHPTSVLTKLNKLSPFTYKVNPKGSVPDYIKCANGQIDAPSGVKSNALVTAYYKDSSRAPAKMAYVQKDLGGGHIKEYDETEKEFEIYVILFDKVFCYYRCTNNVTYGPDFGACAVPVSTVNYPETKEAIKECKIKLKAAGITGLVDIATCDSA